MEKGTKVGLPKPSVQPTEQPALQEPDTTQLSDPDKPSLSIFFLIEFAKWGSLLIAAYILLAIAYPYFRKTINAIYFVFVGEELLAD